MKKTKETSLTWGDEDEKKLKAVTSDLEAVTKRIEEVKNPKTVESAKAEGDYVVVNVVGNGGLRFDPMTGKELASVEAITFTIPEWNLFKKHHSNLGYRIVGVVTDPTGEAESYVVK